MSRSSPHRFFRSFLAILPISLALLTAIGCTKSSDSTKSDDGKSADEKASDRPPEPGRPILEAMAEAYRKAKTYQDKGIVQLTAQSGDQRIDEKCDYCVAFERPNKIHVDAGGDDYKVRIRCDGEFFRAFISDVPGQIVERDAPPKIDLNSLYGDPILLDKITACWPAGAPRQPLLLLNDKALNIMLTGAGEPVLLEPGDIEGRQCYRVRIPQRDGSATFWIDQETYVLRRMVLPVEGELRHILAQRLRGEVESSSLIVELTGASFDRPVNPVAFLFEKPRDREYKTQKFFLPEHPGELIGKKTPPFSFTNEAGRTITPDSLTGKVAVMLFWSAQRGSYSRGLTDLQKIYDAYQNDKGVSVFAVCLDGNAIDSSAFEALQKSMNLHLPIYRDLGEKLPYRFPGVVYILGPYGTVQDFEPVDENLVATLERKIEASIAGQSLAEEAKQRYQQDMDNYLKKAEAIAAGEPLAPPAKTAPRTEPKTFQLKSLWKCPEVKSPGNILVLEEPKKSPRLFVANPPNLVYEVGLDGKVAAVHKLNLNNDEMIANLRAFTAPKGKTYLAAFAGGQQRLHVFTLDDKESVVYPADALKNPHSGIHDVELYDLDGDGTPEIYVGFAGVVGVHAVGLDGKRIGNNQSLANVERMGAGPADADGQRSLICTNLSDRNAVLTVLNAKLQRQGDFNVEGRMIYGFQGTDLLGRGDLLWCGLSTTKPDETTAVGFDLTGKELWHYDLPGDPQPRPIEPIIAGRMTAKGPGQWILPGSDGSIHILSAEGKPLERFNFGEVLQGLATVQIGGKPAFLIATPSGLEAFSVEPK